MKTLAFTAESNSQYESLAVEVSRRFKELNGIECRVLTPSNFNFTKVRSPHWVKTFLWEQTPDDVERILWLDVDVVLLRAMDPLPDAPFAAVHDEFQHFNHCKSVSAAVRRLPNFFSTGFFMAQRASIPAFVEAQKNMWEEPGLAGAHGERSCLNVAMFDILGGWKELPPIYNWVPSNGYPNDKCIMIHYAGGSAEKHHVSATIEQLLKNERRRPL